MALIETHIENRVATITFNRPEALNALSREVIAAFREAIRTLRQDRNVSVVVLTGAGEKAFIAGADIKGMAELTPIQAAAFAAEGQDALFELERMPQVSIAAVNGFALGGGCEFAMACDLIYAADVAKFGQPEVNLGIPAGFGGTQRLTRLVGPMKAREMLLLGKPITAEKAEAIGLCAAVFPKDQLMAQVRAIAGELVEKGPEALAKTKALIREGMDLDLGRAIALERESFAVCFSSPNQKEGMAAFLEKRKPNWERT